jgi:hypothetical protein
VPATADFRAPTGQTGQLGLQRGDLARNLTPRASECVGELGLVSKRAAASGLSVGLPVAGRHGHHVRGGSRRGRPGDQRRDRNRLQDVLKGLQTDLPAMGFTPKNGESEPHDAESDWSSAEFDGRWAIRELSQCGNQTLVSVVARKK